MAARIATQLRSKPLLPFLLHLSSATAPVRAISTQTYFCQEPQGHDKASPLPPNPSTGSPLYQENWRIPIPPGKGNQSLVSTSPAFSVPNVPTLDDAQTPDVSSLMNLFADWMTSQRWPDMKQLFESWIRSLDASGKPNKPDVSLYNHYLRANLMLGATAADLLDLVAQMEDYQITPNAASFNLVLKSMCQARESDAAEKLLDRMLQTGSATLPDDGSYNLVINLLFSEDQVDGALKFLDLMLKSGYMLSTTVFTICAKACIKVGRLDTLASIIEKCKKMDQNKALCPNWNLSNVVLDFALRADHSKLAYLCFEFLARRMARGEAARPPVLLSVDEWLVVSALSVAARTYDSTLLDASWAILRRSLRQKRQPNPESYLGKIHAFASLGNLQRAFSTLNEFESVYGDSPDAEELFSPFTSLHPLAVSCCKNGFATLDTVYFQLEGLSKADPPYKSVAALNCVILGSANIWDLERSYETFESIEKTFGLVPDVHSYNALICAFGKHQKTDEASKVFDHLISLSVPPNATTYSLLAVAHLINRDQKAALTVIDDMVNAGYVPSKDLLSKVERRCCRESDLDSRGKVQSLLREFKYRLIGEGRRDQLFNLQYTTEYG